MACPIPRVSLDVLTRTLLPYFPNISYPQLRSALRNQLNSIYDKPADGSNSYESVSRAEASWYVLEAQADLKQGGIPSERLTIMTMLQQMFFQGRPSWQPSQSEPKYPTQITACADGDTCRALIQEDLQCPPLPEALRYSAVDTPESLPSQKLNYVVKEVAKKLAAVYSLPPQALEPLAPLVKFRIQYAGKIASFIMKDFEAWLQSQGGHFAVSNSYVHVGSKYLGLWQAYDTYMRRVITLHATPEAIRRYFQVRLPVLMGTVGQAFYQEALPKYTGLFQSSPIAFSFLAPQTLLNPVLVYTPQVGAALAATWQGDDWTAALIFMGVAYYYAKYNNQHGAAYGAIQARTQEANIGLWQDLVFRVMDRSVVPPVPDPPD